MSFRRLFLLFSIIFSGDANAQVLPSQDPSSWILMASQSDEFDGSTLDTTKWWPVDPCNYTDSTGHGDNWSRGAFFRPQNVSLNNGNLVITIDYNPDSLSDSIPCIHHHTYPFYSGGILSVLKRNGHSLETRGNYSFGYYEMRAKLPGYYDSNHQPVGIGFTPTFWIYYQLWDTSCIVRHDEADILEPNASQYYDARTNVVGWHDEIGTCSVNKVGQDSVRSIHPLFEDYHTYSMMLMPDKIIFYFDDVPFYSADTISDPGYVHSLNMSPYLALIVNVQIGDNPAPMHDAPFPQYMYVDYVRYYQVKENNPWNQLFQNEPNPVMTTTKIPFHLEPGSVNPQLNICNILGKQIKSIPLSENEKSVNIDCSDLSSGVYFYDLNINNATVGVKKMIVIR